MLFNSVVFVLFAAVFFAAWPLLRRGRNTRWVYLTAASFLFYGWWDARFLLLIMASGFIDFFAALGMERWEKKRKLFLVLSILGNVGSLGIFKYLYFWIRNVNWLLGAAGLDVALPVVSLTLPVGISFYTFQSMSYTFEVYRGKITPTRNVFHFFAYLSMFPQLVAGPIVRAAHLLPQLEEVPSTTERQRWEGTKLIAWGYFKKSVVADSLAPVVTRAFELGTGIESSMCWWIIMVMFAYQIYCDFSGYSDIARGLGRWMGYDFPVNFNHPYVSRSIREFWRRWHISLSTWFRDYVYIPLGGSEKGFAAALWNMWIAMVVSGLWHGAAWTFVIWGALHALYMTVERITKWPANLERVTGGRHLAAAITFVLVLVSWVFFRATSFSQAGFIITRMLDFSGFTLAGIPGFFTGDYFARMPDLLKSNDPAAAVYVWKAVIVTILMILGDLAVYLGFAERWRSESRWMRIIEPVGVALVLVVCVLFRGPGTAFIYFQF
jgi:D-alanyl-lipoteichoic acid acyltransferase DltB (MBOAT superfamily)